MKIDAVQNEWMYVGWGNERERGRRGGQGGAIKGKGLCGELRIHTRDG
jgi:hypothetical protein